jgi:hypothetical protein
MRGKFKDLVEDTRHQLLASFEPEKAEKPPPQPSFNDLMRDCRGVVADAPCDYATNPEYMERFGG